LLWLSLAKARSRGFPGRSLTVSSDSSLRFEQSSPPEIPVPEAVKACHGALSLITSARRVGSAPQSAGKLSDQGERLKSTGNSVDPHDYNFE
jgi:hypothetical protein